VFELEFVLAWIGIIKQSPSSSFFSKVPTSIFPFLSK
jgi:hypothetical protein